VSNINKSYFIHHYLLTKWYQSQVHSIKRDLSWRRKRRKRRRKRKEKEKREMSEKYEEKKEIRKMRRHSSKHFKLRHQSKTKMYSILKIFEVEGVAVEVEEMVTVVETVVKKGIMRRMSNQANKTRR
jgi:sRNA-binding protein